MHNMLEDVISYVSIVTDYINERGSNAYTAGLDVSKEFDCVNHYGIFIAYFKYFYKLA